METYNYPTEKMTVGQTFSVKHSDGYVANETVAKVINDGYNVYYVCESAAVYSQSEI